MVPLSSRERQILAELEASLARDFPDDPAVRYGRDVQAERDVQDRHDVQDRRDVLEEPHRGERPAPSTPDGRPGPRTPGLPADSARPDGRPDAPERPHRLRRLRGLLRSRRMFTLLAIVSFVLLGIGMVTGNLWVVVAFVVTWAATFVTGAVRLLAWSRRQGY